MSNWIPGYQRFPTFINISPAVPLALSGQLATAQAEADKGRFLNQPMASRSQSLITNWVLVRGQYANRLRGVGVGLADKQLDRSIQLSEV